MRYELGAKLARRGVISGSKPLRSAPGANEWIQESTAYPLRLPLPRLGSGMGSCFHFLPRRLQYLRQDIFNRLRRDTSIDESQACARPSFARGTDGSNPPPSSKESCELRYGRRRPADQVVRRREHKMQRFKSARSAQHEILRWFVYRSRAGLVRRICSSARTVASTGRPRSHARRSAQGRLARGVSTPAPVPHTAGVNRTYLSKLETRAS